MHAFSSYFLNTYKSWLNQAYYFEKKTFQCWKRTLKLEVSTCLYSKFLFKMVWDQNIWCKTKPKVLKINWFSNSNFCNFSQKHKLEMELQTQRNNNEFSKFWTNQISKEWKLNVLVSTENGSCSEIYFKEVFSHSCQATNLNMF